MIDFLKNLYGESREDKNIFQKFANTQDKNDHLLKLGIITKEEWFKRENPELYVGSPSKVEIL